MPRPLTKDQTMTSPRRLLSTKSPVSFSRSFFSDACMKAAVEKVFSGKRARDSLQIRTGVIKRLIADAVATLGLDLNTRRHAEIRRSISFPPALKQAAISVLSYFGEIVQHRYPDMDVGVTIEQARDRVTLIVTTPHGTEERIERELDSYGQVVTGETTPEIYLGNTHAAAALRHKLEIAALELRQTKQLMDSERMQYGARIGALEADVRFLRNLLERTAY